MERCTRKKFDFQRPHREDPFTHAEECTRLFVLILQKFSCTLRMMIAFVEVIGDDQRL